MKEELFSSELKKKEESLVAFRLECDELTKQLGNKNKRETDILNQYAISMKTSKNALLRQRRKPRTKRRPL